MSFSRFVYKTRHTRLRKCDTIKHITPIRSINLSKGKSKPKLLIGVGASLLSISVMLSGMKIVKLFKSGLTLI